MFSKATTDFFIGLINDIIKLKEEGQSDQWDMMNMLLEAKKEYEAQQKKGRRSNTSTFK